MVFKVLINICYKIFHTESQTAFVFHSVLDGQ